MILSHKHKFIFIKTNKTAGTSVEIALSKFCGPEDIVTPISDVDEDLRHELGYASAQNFGEKDDGSPLFYNHMSALEVKELVDHDVWKRYYKFCIERNPWDRVISLYFWATRSWPEENRNIDEFVQSDIVLKLKRKGINLYSHNGGLLVDKILAYENLESGLCDVLETLDMDSSRLELPLTKANHRTDRRHYSEVLSKESIDRVSNLFQDEISLMKYHF